jgi:tRNA-splicing ligase RtcB
MAVHILGDHDEQTVRQLEQCVAVEPGAQGVLCADGHLGYSMPIGGVVAYREHVSPSGVGFDIGCLAAGTPVTTADGFAVPIEQVEPGLPVSCWDGHRVRIAQPCFGVLERGRRAVLRLRLANERDLLATGDHRIRTKLGWERLDGLRPGDEVACPVFTGVPHEMPPGDLAAELARPEDAAELQRRALWPLRPADPRFPALLRVLAYAAGDGHLHRDGTGISLCTTVLGDAADLCADLAVLAFTPSLYVRDRGHGRRLEHCVRVRSGALHALLAALGCPTGRKVDGCAPGPMPWLFGLPAWQRAHFLSAFASAEATTPALSDGRIANLAIKQAGTTSAAIELLVDLFASLGFRCGVTLSGPVRGDVRTQVVQVLGGEREQLRFLEEIGFCRAIAKREAAAAAASVAWQTDAIRRARAAAADEARALAAAGGRTIRQIRALVAARHGVAPVFAHHAIYGRGAPRRPVGAVATPDYSGEVAWVAVTSVEPAGDAEVFDVGTGDAAASFVGGGICVHNCGNKAARTNLTYDDIAPDVPRIMDEIFGRISFGVGRRDGKAGGHPVIDEIRQAAFAPQRALAKTAALQLGTVGAGNHYVDLFRDEDDRVWVGVHFGSRGFGHKTASGFLALAQGMAFDARAAEGEMMTAPVVFAAGSELGRSYVEAMTLAGRYAYAGRDVVVGEVLEILGAQADLEVHNNHNFGWLETHDGESYWVVRKGATPAFPGQLGFVGATMGEPAVILEGVDSAASRAALYSTIHGAGRAMSRTQAAGRMGTRMECSVRDCPHWVTRRAYQAGERCPAHPKARMLKRRGRVKPGRIDFAAVRAELAAKGIELRGGAADEAPAAYKRLDDVLAYHEGTVRVLHRLYPIGVAMAPAETYDPFKD